MNTRTREAAYVRTRNGGKLTPKQNRRLNKKSHADAGHVMDQTVTARFANAGRVTVTASIDTEQFDRAKKQIADLPVPVTAKVGIITYTGYVCDGDEFHYTTKGGVAKKARKFTVI